MKKADRQAVDEVMQFLNAYAEYHISDTDDDGEPTDAQMLVRNIPVLKKLLEAKPKPKTKQKECSPNYDKLYETDQKFKNYVDYKMRYARESVNPNCKYCVVNEGLSKLTLTDNLDAAMQYASTRSKMHPYTTYMVLRIALMDDGTYKTIKECWYSNGEYFEGHSFYFLHYDYIARCATLTKKI